MRSPQSTIIIDGPVVSARVNDAVYRVSTELFMKIKEGKANGMET